ncbi:hypothetical protein ACHHYP_15623 [Achlya hypogyna]|uniref:FYVE-type domain-containing protein n=1 Tax=Achlya hypogyna TaxID=1202772 RepID=A0A1V9YAJ1_ACHHY|nr:hypothetical protein ACHHYP_15623 [Achlya hypogyna]
MIKTLTTCPGMWCLDAGNDDSPPAMGRSQRFVGSARRNVLGATEAPPAWEDDDVVDACTGCNVAFGLFHRKHHCRACGHVFCGSCANDFEKLLKCDLTTPVRICQRCSPSVLRENDFYDRFLPLLRAGECFVKYGFILDRCVKLVLIDNSLQYQTIDLNTQQHSGDTKIIMLETISGVEALEQLTLLIKTPSQTHKLGAPSVSTRDDWVAAVQAAVDLLQHQAIVENAKMAKDIAKEHAEMNRVIQGMESIELRRIEMQRNRLMKNSSRRDELRAKYGLPVPAAT